MLCVHLCYRPWCLPAADPLMHALGISVCPVDMHLVSHEDPQAQCSRNLNAFATLDKCNNWKKECVYR